MKDLSKYNLLGLVLLFAGCGTATLQEQHYQGGALGTSYAITTYSETPEDLRPAIDSVFRVLNQSLSTYQADSDISRINAGDSTVQVDQMFREVLEASKEVFEATDGYFDPTVGTLVDAWGFGPGQALIMDSTRVDSLLLYVGLEKVSLGPDGRIRKTVPGIRLDFNAIAKGYAIDRLAAMLDAHGVPNYLVEVGGEVRTRGGHPLKGQPWRVGIDDPQVTEGRRIKQIVNLEDRSMASSGNYRKFRVDPGTGEKFVHTIDPHTGFTRNARVLATSVIAPTCMLADAYATAFMAMELEASQALLASDPELEGYIIYLDDAGQPAEYMTAGFRERVQDLGITP
ncbi:FAD:protein FMN transferase [Robiginitalea sp. M366]|uniref:FAD:protein FMN transferase n=1 Tax=Robiginitalea aestuariiviva TaxID=3036903 RepID=UPI00240CF379|nr:FAD:protein FMN transferase [Robiginitalea aestuariiviva]MDG1570806.1 FAD:protein FMN transferase [Robiginitalea aestuariiviva]